jgi:hypothetical protein
MVVVEFAGLSFEGTDCEPYEVTGAGSTPLANTRPVTVGEGLSSGGASFARRRGFLVEAMGILSSSPSKPSATKRVRTAWSCNDFLCTRTGRDVDDGLIWSFPDHEPPSRPVWRMEEDAFFNGDGGREGMEPLQSLVMGRSRD